MIHCLDESAMDVADEDSSEAIQAGKAIDAWDEEIKARSILVGGRLRPAEWRQRKSSTAPRPSSFCPQRFTKLPVSGRCDFCA